MHPVGSRRRTIDDQSVVSSPSPGLGEDVLTGVTALAPNNAWAVGFYAKEVNTDRPTKTLIEHWDGSSWKVVSSPNIGPHSVYQSNHLGGITTVSANDVWASVTTTLPTALLKSLR